MYWFDVQNWSVLEVELNNRAVDQFPLLFGCNRGLFCEWISSHRVKFHQWPQFSSLPIIVVSEFAIIILRLTKLWCESRSNIAALPKPHVCNRNCVKLPAKFHLLMMYLENRRPGDYRLLFTLKSSGRGSDTSNDLNTPPQIPSQPQLLYRWTSIYFVCLPHLNLPRPLFLESSIIEEVLFQPRTAIILFKVFCHSVSSLFTIWALRSSRCRCYSAKIKVLWEF